MRTARHIAEEVEGQAVHRIGQPRDHRQLEREQLRDQPTLGQLELAPQLAVGLDRQVGDGACDAAGQAEAGHQPVGVEGRIVALARRRHHPVAGRRRQEVVAAPVGLALRIAEDGEGVRLGTLARVGRERDDAQVLDDVAQRRLAGEAPAVAQEHGPAALALVGAGDRWGLQLGGQRGRGLGADVCGCLVVGGGFHVSLHLALFAEERRDIVEAAHAAAG
jgi:hypothetical protein